jgi:hypothetical protein
MIRGAALIGLLVCCGAAQAQDIRGMESCTQEKKLDRRIGCLQANTEFLQLQIQKNAADTQQKLAIASREVAVLREAVATLQVAIARLENTKEDKKEEKR